MKHNDAQSGKPGVLYTNTKTNIEALTGLVEGSHAYATDTDKYGTYDGSLWDWSQSGASGTGGGIERSGSTTDEHLAVWNGTDADSLKDGGAVPAGSSTDGWVAAGQTWTYEAGDDPTYTFSEPIDATGKYSLGMKLKCTQGGSTKYGIVTAVGAYSGGKTIITAYWGTDYDLGATITNPYYSTAKAPFGFPLDPAKWTVRVVDATSYNVAANDTNWHNLGSTISVPIGVWDLSYQAAIAKGKNAVADQDVLSTLSTANNSESDSDFTAHGYISAAAGAGGFIEITVNRRKFVTLAAKATYYLNLKTTTSGGAGTSVYLGSFANNTSSTILEAVCAYL